MATADPTAGEWIFTPRRSHLLADAALEAAESNDDNEATIAEALVSIAATLRTIDLSLRHISKNTQYLNPNHEETTTP